MQSLQKQYSSSKVIFFCLCLCHINGPLYTELPWNLTQAYLLLLCLMRGNPVVWATWCLRHFTGPLQLGNKTPCKKVTPLKDLRMPWAFELDAEVHRKEKWGHTLVENVQFESDLKRWISVRSSSSIAIWGSGRQHPAAPPCPQGGGSVWFAL